MFIIDSAYMKDIISIISRDTPGLVAKANPNSRNRAGLALLRLKENLQRLEKRHDEYLTIEQIFSNNLDELDPGITLEKLQLDFVDKVEAFHQQVYSTISVLVMVLNYIGIEDVKDKHPHRSMQKFLAFLKKSPKFKTEFHKWIDILLESVRFRADFIDHPQGRPAYDWMTSQYDGEVFVIYYELAESLIPYNSADTPWANHPRHPDFRPPINSTKFFVSPDRIITYHAMKVLVRVLLSRNDLEHDVS